MNGNLPQTAGAPLNMMPGLSFGGLNPIHHGNS